MIDNSKVIFPILKWRSNDDFYYLQILQRKKENPHLGSNSRVIKNYYIKSMEEMERNWPEIKKLCDVFNARASIRLNRRSLRKTAFSAMERLAGQMRSDYYRECKSAYDRACGRNHNEKEDKNWIIDIDEHLSGRELLKMRNILQKATPERKDRVIAYVPSLAGGHLIVRPFDTLKCDIHVEHKDNPTNLYIP